MANENNIPAEENASAYTQSEKQEIKKLPETNQIQAATQETQKAEEVQEVIEASQETAPPATETDIPLQPTPESSDNVKIEILNVRVFEPEGSAAVSTLKKNLGAELRFRISGTQAEILTIEHRPFQISIYTVDLRSKTLKLVASEERELKTQEFEYTIQKEFLLPKPGRYEFHTIVLLLPPYTRMKFYQGPILSVVL